MLPSLLGGVIGGISGAAMGLVDRLIHGLPNNHMRFFAVAFATGLSVAILTQSFAWSIVSKKRANEITSQIEKIKNASANNKKRLLILQSTDGIREHIGHGFLFPRFARQIQKWGKTHAIHHVIIPDRVKLLDSLTNSFDKYDVIWIRGHGFPSGVRLGNYILSKNDQEVMRLLSKKANKGAFVLFESCLSGRGESNIGKDFSIACPDSTVYATKSLHNIRDNLDFIRCRPRFRDLFGKDSTKVYRAGVQIHHPHAGYLKK